MMSRTVSWFSCGAASAVATKIAVMECPETIVAYCEVAEEHPDNKRFLSDVERWLGKEIIVMGNDDYDRSCYKVYEKTRWLSGQRGARCSVELKKRVRQEFELPDDRQVFGFTAEEQERVNRFIDANPDVDIWPVLIEHGLTKDDCLGIIDRAGIELPAMYKLGYRNNNCRGCVRTDSAAYWKKIKIDFPENAAQLMKYEKLLGVKLVRVTVDGERKRFGLDEIPEHIEPLDDSVDVQCGIFCEMADQEIRKRYE
jgi:hypothetical protein